MSEQEICIGIAARLWCDQDMASVVMDATAAHEIAAIVQRVRSSDSIEALPAD